MKAFSALSVGAVMLAGSIAIAATACGNAGEDGANGGGSDPQPEHGPTSGPDASSAAAQPEEDAGDDIANDASLASDGHAPACAIPGDAGQAGCAEEILIAFGSSVRRTLSFDGTSFPIDAHDVKDAGIDASAAEYYSMADHDKDYSADIGLGVMVVVGDRGAFSSTDGVTWNAISAITGNMHSARVVFTGDKLVVVSLASVFTSSDGATWTQKDDPWTIGHLQASLYAHGTILVFGENGTLHRSTDDGTTFTAQTFAAVGGVLATNFSVASNGKRLVAVARTPLGFRATSDDDGATWSVKTGGTASDQSALDFGTGILWNGAEYVVLPGFNAPATYVSPTGTDPWQVAPVGPRVGAATSFGTGYIGVGGPSSDKIYASLDAKSWNATPVFPIGVDPASLYPSPNVLSYYGIAHGRLAK